MSSRRELILGAVEDLVGNLLWYDRKEDEELPRGEIEVAVASGEVTIDEMTGKFRAALTEGLN